MKALRLLDRDGQDGKIEAALAAWPDLRVDDSLLIKPRRQRSTIPSRQSAPSSQPQGKFPSRGGLGSLGFFGPQSDASASSLQPPLPSPATSPSALLLPGPRLQPSAFNAQLPNPAQPNLAAQRQDRQEQQQQGVTLLPSAAYAAPPSSSNGGYGSISGASLNNQGRGNGGQLQQMARQSGQVSQSRDLHPRSLRPGPPENAAASLAEGSGPLADALLRGHHHPLEGLTPSFTAPPASDLRVAAASVLAGRAARQPAPAAIALAAAAAGLQPPRQQQQQQQQGRIATMGEARAKNWRQNTSQGALLPLIPNSAPIGGEWQSVRSLVQNPQALAILQLKSHSCHGQVVSERRADHGASSSCSPRLLDVDKWLCRLTVKGIGGNQGNQLTLEYCCPHHSSFVRQQ